MPHNIRLCQTQVNIVGSSWNDSPQILCASDTCRVCAAQEMWVLKCYASTTCCKFPPFRFGGAQTQRPEILADVQHSRNN